MKYKEPRRDQNPIPNPYLSLLVPVPPVLPSETKPPDVRLGCGRENGRASKTAKTETLRLKLECGHGGQEGKNCKLLGDVILTQGGGGEPGQVRMHEIFVHCMGDCGVVGGWVGCGPWVAY